jgi:hypothetical protein
VGRPEQDSPALVGDLQANKQQYTRRMASSGMLRRVALVRTDVSEELSSSFIRVTRMVELGTGLAVTSNRLTLRRVCETSVLTRATGRNIPKDDILQNSVHCHNRTPEDIFKLPQLTSLG